VEGKEQASSAEDDAPPELTEQRFAANLRGVREDSRMSQYALAQEMSERGWPWRQQTVARVETGQRMVRLGEATAIAEILQVPLDMLILPRGESRDAELLTEWMQRAQSAFAQIMSAAAELIVTRKNLHSHPAVAAGIAQPHSPQMRMLIAEANAMHEVLTPSAAIAEAERMLEEKEQKSRNGSRAETDGA
jgi:transcriptional regulator with XRE-family HTH domain